MKAFVFPGQGSQYIGMGKDLLEVAEDLFREASKIVGFDLYSLCVEGPEIELNKTENTQPAIFTVSYILAKEVLKAGIKPDYLCGHSLGEYTAAAVAGVFSFADGVKITRKRGELMQQAQPEGKGAMAAVLGVDEEEVKNICRSVKSGYVDIANFNCPGQLVISGERQAVQEATELAKQRGAKKVVLLQVSVPSHCLLMKKASELFRDFLSHFKFSNANIPIVTNVDAIQKTNSQEIFESFIKQLYSSVLWQDCVKYMISKGVNTFFEIGPGKVLAGLIKRISPEVKIFNIEKIKDIQTLKEEIE
ncbi:MAG: ACP S-malonyltransferase [Thermodesulfovibrionaceae bacterium]